jgi:tetratricopeptide (TPR) repeat protein
MHVPFHLDDKTSIVENPEIKDMGTFIEPLKGKDSTASYTIKTRYIGYLTFALNYKLHGLDVTGYHVNNLLIHIINAILVYFLVILTFKTPVIQQVMNQSTHNPLSKGGNLDNLIALFSALFFLSHPLQTQAVTYIVQRLASLTTMFYLFSIVMYINARLLLSKINVKPFSASAAIFYSLSLISAVFAMKTKEIAFTLPLIISLYEFIFFEGKIMRRVLYLIPLLLTMTIIPLGLVDIDKPVGELIGDVGKATAVQTQMSRLDYLFTQLRVIVTYIRLIFLPINQNLLYDYPIYRSLFDTNVIFSLLFLLFLFSTAVYLLYAGSQRTSQRHYNGVYQSWFTVQRLRLISFGILWFFITLSVESSVIPIKHVIFEHRLYLPSAGIIIAITTSLFLAVNKLRDRWTVGGKITTAIFICIVFSLGGATYARNIIWQDEVTLWEDVVKKSPHHPAALTNLGEAYAKKGQIDKAIGNFHKAISIYPDLIEAYSNLGVAYSMKGQPDKAISYFNRMIKLKPDDPRAYYNLGMTYGQKGLFDKAIDYFKRSIALKPDYFKAYNQLGLAYYFKGWFDQAITEYLNAIKLQPDYAEAHYNVGVTYSKKGMQDKAEEHFQKARILGQLDKEM